MKVLIACEHSGIVRDAFAARGHDAWSCDLLPSERAGQHLMCDARTVLDRGWDLMIAHPDCTYLTVANNGPMANGCQLYTAEQAMQFRSDAIAFFMLFANSTIPRIAIENPVGIMSTKYRKPDQYIQPYQFGHDASKNTCLWLKGLPKLQPTRYVEPRWVNGKPRWANQTDSGQNREPPSDDRWKIRAKTYQGIADAMATQWGEPHARNSSCQRLLFAD